MITSGDRVRVALDAAVDGAVGTVLYIGADYCAIAVVFDTPPPFPTFTGQGFSILASDGRAILLATSDGIVDLAAGEIISPWFELFTRQPFDITAC